MASLTPEEYEYAINLDYDKLPNRLRCAVCNKAVVDAMKTECCDTVVCGPCAATLGNTCPVCEYSGTAGITREDKRTRTTLKAHIKGELQKRNNAAAAAAAAAAKEAKVQEAVATPVVEELDEVLAPAAEEALVEEIDEVQDTNVDVTAPEGDAEDLGDDKSDIEIITERPEPQTQLQTFNAMPEQQEEPQEQGPGDNQFQQNQMPFDPQQMFNNMSMSGFNPMLAMQGMNMPFPMMPNMMGMPMDPSMLFGGGFAGMNGMANMMSGNMMNGNFGMPGMGDMNDFNQYNQYGNRFDNRPFHSNRGRGYGQDFRGRGRGFHRGRGRGGGWHQQQQYQQYGQQNYDDQQQGYPQDNHASDYANGANGANQEPANEQHPQNGEQSYDDVVQEEQSNSHETNDIAPVQEEAYEEAKQVESDLQIPITAPPVNAPTGPRAMREGLPNSGRYSRPQVQNETSRPVSRDQAPTFNPPKGPSAHRRQDEVRDDVESERRGSNARSRSPRPTSKRHRSRSPRREYDDDDDEDRYAEDKRRRKRDREYDSGREYEKKRSRSGTPDERRHRHRDDKERRREKSREKRRRSRDREGDDHERRKSKHRSRREDKYGDDYQEEPKARPAVEDNSDDIGFKIKGTSSGKVATARSDPYAEERERMKEQRLQRDAERRQTSNGKRGRDDNGDDHGGKKRRSRPKAKYEDEIGDHEQERERNRWR